MATHQSDENLKGQLLIPIGLLDLKFPTENDPRGIQFSSCMPVAFRYHILFHDKNIQGFDTARFSKKNYPS